MAEMKNAPINVNGRTYRWMDRPLVVVCVDGCEPDYITQAMQAGVAPYLREMCGKGTSLLGDAVVPSFTNPNNLSIVTGTPPAVHGICGNYFYDRDADKEVMMNDPQYLRAGTIHAKFSQAGAKVAVVTAKDKLRTMLGHEVKDGICFSAEKANETTEAKNGIKDALGFVGMPLPSVYSAQLSEFVFAAGVKLLETRKPDLIYLSTTDYVQHKDAPGTPGANDFYKMMDGYLKKLDALGATVALTADHGMNAKNDGAGDPKVIFVESLLHEKFGKKLRVICPITDPYVVHHGALGSLVMVHLEDTSMRGEVAEFLFAQPGITEVLTREQAVDKLELAPDRIGDLVVLSGRDVVVGKSPEHHDLSVLKGGLRSHGGRYEEMVPLVISKPLTADLRRLAEGDPRNFDVFHFACHV